MRFLISEKLGPHKYKTQEGYLVCVDAILSRTGSQDYKRSELFGDSCENPDDIISVNRTHDEVFSNEAMASFENKPICIEHPDVDVNSENHNDLSVGFVRDIHKGKDNGQDVMMGTLVITDKNAVEAVENGEYKELSCGYDCDIDDAQNPVQKNIRGNHIALCKQGRAGIARIVDSVNDAKVRYNKNTKLTLSNLPDEVLKVDFYELYNKLNKLIQNNWRYRIATYGDRFKLVLEKAINATLGTYGPVGGYWKEVKTIYCIDNFEDSKFKDNIVSDANQIVNIKVIKKTKTDRGIIYLLQGVIDNQQIYIVVTDSQYKGGTTYSGGGAIAFSQSSAEQTFNSWVKIDNLSAKYGEEEAKKRYMLGQDEQSIIDSWSEVEEKNYAKANNINDATVIMNWAKDFDEILTKVETGFGKLVQKTINGKLQYFIERHDRYYFISNEDAQRLQRHGFIVYDSIKPEQVFTVEYKQGDTIYVRKVRATSIEDAIKKAKDVYNKFEHENDKEFLRNAISEMRRYIRNWSYMSKHEKQNIAPEGFTSLKQNLEFAEQRLKLLK